MNKQVVTVDQNSVIEQVVIQGDLAQLSPPQRVQYYRQVCDSVGLNPFTKPFDYIKLNGRLTLYAKKDATEQLRRIHGVSIDKPDIQYLDDLVVVTVTARDNENRTDSDLGAVAVGNLKGDAKANAIMKAITKAKRRVTLSICGLGWLDETEIETIPDARPVHIDTDTGEIVEEEVTVRAETPPAPPQKQAPPPATSSSGKSQRPLSPVALSDAMARKTKNDDGRPASDKQQQYAAASLSVITLDDHERYDLTEFLFGIRSTKELTAAQASAIIDWVSYQKDGDDWIFSEDAKQEASAALRQFAIDKGQMGLFPEGVEVAIVYSAEDEEE